MHHLKEFLIRLQTFELRLVTQASYNEKARNRKEKEVDAYDLKHETGFYDAYPFKSELRVLKDMAVLDLAAAPKPIIKVAFQQIDKLQQRFKTFWTNFQNNYQNSQQYQEDYLYAIGLNDLFVVHNLERSFSGIFIDGTFVDDLAESVKLRELFLQELLQEVKDILSRSDLPQQNEVVNIIPLPAKSLFAEEKEIPQQEIHSKEAETGHSQNSARGSIAKEPQSANQISEGTNQSVSSAQSPVAPGAINKAPTFTGTTLGSFYELFKDYFSVEDRQYLLPLLKDNSKPTLPLVFKGNGNQLADAFKQLYEANLIVGCTKTELEEWISLNFEYVYRDQQKTLPASYLNSIISSNTKPCQSPILDIKKQPDGTFTVVPTLRNTKNNR